jgi:hypothetical protein
LNSVILIEIFDVRRTAWILVVDLNGASTATLTMSQKSSNEGDEENLKEEYWYYHTYYDIRDEHLLHLSSILKC